MNYFNAFRFFLGIQEDVSLLHRFKFDRKMPHNGIFIRNFITMSECLREFFLSDTDPYFTFLQGTAVDSFDHPDFIRFFKW